MMPKSDTIEAILKLNPTAEPQFLAEFSNEELLAYLDRLTGPGRLVASADRASPEARPAGRAAEALPAPAAPAQRTDALRPRPTLVAYSTRG